MPQLAVPPWSRWAVAATAYLLPVLHPLLRPVVGVPSHLLWFVHPLPVAIVAYGLGARAAVLAVAASAFSICAGEWLFGAGYGVAADNATIAAMVVSVGLTNAAVAGFALAVRAEQTRRRQVQDQLMQAQKLEAIGRLAGGVAHDFNNLLTVILSTTQLRIEATPPDDPAREELEEIEGAARSAARLTGQLLAFSRRQPHRPRALDMNEVVRGTEPMIRRLVGEDIAVAAQLQAGLNAVEADPGQVEQVLLNLVVNGRDAMPGGGRLTISTGRASVTPQAGNGAMRAGEYVVLTVADTGTGMDAATQARVFEPFFTTKAPGKGTGLGLSTVFGIVSQSGGTVRIDTRPGDGTRVATYWPMLRTAEPAARVTEAPAVTRGIGELILLVEDEPLVRDATRRLLTRAGYRVITAANGVEAMRRLDQQGERIDLIVSDVVMPEMGGLELARHVERRGLTVPLLLISGHADDTHALQTLVAEGRPFLAKPFTVVSLGAAVRAKLDGGRRADGEAAHSA